MEFDGIIEGIYDRLDTLERYSRLHAQTIAATDEAVNGNRARLVDMSNDFDAYKVFITSTHKTIDSYLDKRFNEYSEKFDVLTAQLDSFVSVLAPRIEMLDNRVQAIENAF